MSKYPLCKKPVALKKTREDAGDHPPEVLKEAAGKVNGKLIMYFCPSAGQMDDFRGGWSFQERPLGLERLDAA